MNQDEEMPLSKESHEESPTDDNSEFESAPNPKLVTISDEELRRMQRETIEYKEKYLRLLADAENARKRLQKEKQELTRYAIEGMITDFLNPIDNLENALKYAQDASEEVRNWAFGFQMILTQFKDVLAQHNVTCSDSLGTAFDPHLHEAIEMVESDQLPGTIIEECVKGYKLGDRMIRPARVKIAKEQENKKNNKQEELEL